MGLGHGLTATTRNAAPHQRVEPTPHRGWRHRSTHCVRCPAGRSPRGSWHRAPPSRQEAQLCLEPQGQHGARSQVPAPSPGHNRRARGSEPPPAGLRSQAPKPGPGPARTRQPAAQSHPHCVGKQLAMRARRRHEQLSSGFPASGPRLLSGSSPLLQRGVQIVDAFRPVRVDAPILLPIHVDLASIHRVNRGISGRVDAKGAL